MAAFRLPQARGRGGTAARDKILELWCRRVSGTGGFASLVNLELAEADAERGVAGVVAAERSLWGWAGFLCLYTERDLLPGGLCN